MIQIGIFDTISALRDGNYAEIAEKHKCTTTDVILASQARAIEALTYNIPKAPDTCKEEDGRIHAYCPSCEADITDWNDDWNDWSFCPYCGQAIRMMEEKA